MHANITFDFARLYDISKADIVKGQKFSIDITEPSATRWFSDNDKVLGLDVKGSGADAEALEVGTSEILIMSVDYVVQKKIFINVVASVQAPAEGLNAKAGPAEPKE